MPALRTEFVVGVILLAVTGGAWAVGDGVEPEKSPAGTVNGLPAVWLAARVVDRGIEISRAETGSEPAVLVRERKGSRTAGLEVTDLAYDARRGVVYVGTCCEPASGHLWRVETREPSAGLVQDDQGFAVDVAGAGSTMARTDTYGTLALRASAGGEQFVQAEAGVADVAVDGAAPRVIALVDSARLRALVPVVKEQAPAVVVRPVGAKGAPETHPLSGGQVYCRVVALTDGQVGLLAGAPVAGGPVRCAGDRLDAYDTESRRLRSGVLTFPEPVRHLSVDDSSTFLIFVTVQGAVGWRTLDGRGGSLASKGFAAADW